MARAGPWVLLLVVVGLPRSILCELVETRQDSEASISHALHQPRAAFPKSWVTLVRCWKSDQRCVGITRQPRSRRPCHSTAAMGRSRVAVELLFWMRRYLCSRCCPSHLVQPQ